MRIPETIPNLLGADSKSAASGATFEKRSPTDGRLLYRVAASSASDIDAAVQVASRARTSWAATPAVRRGDILLNVVVEMRRRREEIAAVVAAETGKSIKDALGETDGAAALGLFYASEGQRLYGRTATSGVPNRQAMVIRQPVGIAGLIIAANTPIANTAWKVFPALVCGNTAILKAAEDTPATSWLFGEIAKAAGLPDGVLSVVQGIGSEAGAALVAHPQVGVISFTGSTAVGKQIALVAARRLAKVSLELGGKNPFVVCDDANLENAVHWAALSAFSNAGQRCAAGSRILIFESVYETFREQFLQKTAQLKIGPADDHDLGPVISERQLNNMLASVDRARQAGASVIMGGARVTEGSLASGYFMTPTIVENVSTDAEMSRCELFGPIASLYRVRDFEEAVHIANDSDYGLTAAIHTKNIDRAHEFARRVEAGVVSINAGTFGSEPHMPFGGLKQSGNGTREPGTEAIDIYSNLKNVVLNIDPSAV